MKAMILAAGRGERMRPLTDNCPKPLLKIGSKSLIEYHLHALAVAGIKDVVINHAWLGEQIESAIGNGEKYSLNIRYSPETEALETAGGIIQALPLLKNKDNQILVINGDVFCDYPLQRLVAKKITDQVHLVMVPNPIHHKEGDFFLNDAYLSEFNENQKPKLTFSGIGLYHIDFFANLDGGKRALAPLLRAAMSNRQVTGELYTGMWNDVGTPERLEQLNNWFIPRGG